MATETYRIRQSASPEPDVVAVARLKSWIEANVRLGNAVMIEITKFGDVTCSEKPHDA